MNENINEGNPFEYLNEKNIQLISDKLKQKFNLKDDEIKHHRDDDKYTQKDKIIHRYLFTLYPDTLKEKYLFCIEKYGMIYLEMNDHNIAEPCMIVVCDSELKLLDCIIDIFVSYFDSIIKNFREPDYNGIGI